MELMMLMLNGIFRMYKPNFNGRRAQETSRKIEEKFLTPQWVVEQKTMFSWDNIIGSKIYYTSHLIFIHIWLAASYFHKHLPNAAPDSSQTV